MSLTTNNTASYPLHSPITHQQRLDCFCHYRINPKNPFYFATFPSNVRDSIGEVFQVWQCPNRQIIQAYFRCYRPGLLLCQMPGFRHNADLLLSHYLSKITPAIHQTRLIKNYLILDSSCGANALFYSICNKKALLIVIKTWKILTS